MTNTPLHHNAHSTEKHWEAKWNTWSIAIPDTRITYIHFTELLRCPLPWLCFSFVYNFSSCLFFLISLIACLSLCIIPNLPFLITRNLWLSATISLVFASQDFTQKPNSTFCWRYFSHKISFSFTFVLTSILKSNDQTKIMKATFSQPERKADLLPRPPPIDSFKGEVNNWYKND